MAMKMCLFKFCLIWKNKMVHSRLFEKHKDALNLEILQLASSNLYKRHMARKASLIVILGSFKTMLPYHMFNVKWGYPIKKAVLPLLLGVLNVKTTFKKSWPDNLFNCSI